MSKFIKLYEELKVKFTPPPMQDTKKAAADIVKPGTKESPEAVAKTEIVDTRTKELDTNYKDILANIQNYKAEDIEQKVSTEAMFQFERDLAKQIKPFNMKTSYPDYHKTTGKLVKFGFTSPEQAYEFKETVKPFIKPFDVTSQQVWVQAYNLKSSKALDKLTFNTEFAEKFDDDHSVTILVTFKK